VLNRLPMIRVGLRPRLVLALVAVALVALAGPMLELLSPLESQLRNETLDSLAVDARAMSERIARLPAAEITRHSRQLRRIILSFRRTDTDATLIGGRGVVLFGWDPAVQEMVRSATAPPPGRDQRRVINFGNGLGEWARVVTQARTPAGPVTLAVYRSLKDAETARNDLIAGLERAAAVSLLIAVALGIVLANRLLRRTRTLRDAALRIAAAGPGTEPPVDRRRDEIGDLTRAFATMQQRLRSHEHAREAFVATASHELRTPIAALQLQLGLLREDLAADDPDLVDARDQVAHAEAQSARLAKLASDLLDLSAVDAEVALRCEPVPLASLCRATLAEFDGLPGMPPELHLDDSGTALGDPGKIAQIVRILVDNARRHAPADQPVRVIVTGVTITVEDDGPGVSIDERELIFERFRRGSNDDTHPGFGLGLAIGRELARRMNGDLRLGAGVQPTRFELTMPAAPAAPAITTEDLEAPVPAGRTS
jgi:signal transduction histidine kinase